MTQIPINQGIVSPPPVTDPAMVPSANTIVPPEPAALPEPAASPEPDTSQPSSWGLDPSNPSSAPAPLVGATPEIPAVAPPQTFRGMLTASGIDLTALEGQDDQALADHLAGISRQADTAAELTQLAHYGQSVLPYQDQFREFLQNQEQNAGGAPATASTPPAAAAPAPEATPYWSPAPEWKPEWEQFLKSDENGNVVATSPEFGSLVQKYHEHQNWRKGGMDRLLTDPAEAVWGGIEDKVDSMVSDRVAARIEQYNNEQFANSFVQTYQGVLFQQDGNGNSVTDPATGQQILSQTGHMFSDNVRRLQAMGVSDPMAQSQMAMELLQAQMGRSAPAPGPAAAPVADPHGMPPAGAVPAVEPPAPFVAPPVPATAAPPTAAPSIYHPTTAPADPRETFLQEAAANAAHRTPGRAGTVIASQFPNGPPQNAAEGFDTMLDRAMIAGGLMTSGQAGQA